MQNLEIGLLERPETAAMETFSMENVEYLQSIEGLKAENWVELQPHERLDVLRTLESRLAEIQRRPPLPIVAERMEEGLCGYFDGKALHINMEHIQDPAYLQEVTDTVAHEGRHAYQDYAIEHPEIHPDLKEVQYWAANHEHYLNSRKFGLEIYESQPLEVDARHYAGIVKGIFSEFQEDKSFWKFDSKLENAIAKVENDTQRPSLLAQAGDLVSRIKSGIDSIIPPLVQKVLLRAGAMAIAHHRF